MALSIKTEEADRLARELTHLTGETVTGAVTRALREALEREREREARESSAEFVSRIQAHVERLRERYDLDRPITQEEWDAGWGEET